MQQSLASHHLKVLRESGLLEAIRDGPFVRYSVSSPEFKGIILLAGEIVGKNTSTKGDKR
jgi:DNA-binding transcriptional ArsR family regulator